MTAMATTVVTNDSNGSWFCAHVWHTHGAAFPRTCVAHPWCRAHAHIPCAHACARTHTVHVHAFGVYFRLWRVFENQFWVKFRFFSDPARKLYSGFFSKKRQKSKVEDLAKWEKSVNLQGLSPGGDKSSTRFWDFWRQGRGEVEHKYLTFLGFH